MSEERKPYIPMNSSAKLVTEDEQKVEIARRRVAIGLECDKIVALPAGYWPNEWREHLGRLSTCGAALLRLMTNEKEAHELEKRAFAAINEVEKAYLDLEAANFPVTDVSPPEQDPGSMRDV